MKLFKYFKLIPKLLILLEELFMSETHYWINIPTGIIDNETISITLPASLYKAIRDVYLEMK